MTNPTPKSVHDVERAIASFRAMGAGFASMYLEILERGISSDHARDITVEYVRGFVNRPPLPPAA